MNFGKILVSVAAASLAVSPVMAASNPAAGLSLAPALKDVRVSATAQKKRRLSTTVVKIGIAVFVIGGIAGAVYASTTRPASR